MKAYRAYLKRAEDDHFVSLHGATSENVHSRRQCYDNSEQVGQNITDTNSAGGTGDGKVLMTYFLQVKMIILLCRHVMLIVLYCSPASCFTNSRTYLVMPCALDTPTSVLTTKRGAMWCGVQCTTTSICPFYQFKANSKQCELFGSLPGNFTDNKQCTAYVATPSK